jgi:hypothetical protein
MALFVPGRQKIRPERWQGFGEGGGNGRMLNYMVLSISATQLLETVGYAVIPGILPDNQVQRLSRLITSLADAT